MIAASQKNLNSLITHIRAGAKVRGIEFNLDVTDLNNLSFPLTCPILNIPLGFNFGSAKDNSYSIDRIDSSLGYTPDNIIVVSNRANKLKSDATLEELNALSEFYTELHKSINL